MFGGTKLQRVHDFLINPKVWMVFYAISILKWAVLFGPGMILWRESVPFLMYVSLDTALTGSLAGFGTTLAARKADKDDPF